MSAPPGAFAARSARPVAPHPRFRRPCDHPAPRRPQDLSVPVPPPGCPAHDLGPDGTHRLYGPVAETDPPAMYELLRREYGPVAPVLLHGDLPAWLVLGHRENLEVMRTPSLFSRDSRRWSMFREHRVPDDSPLRPMIGWQPSCVFADGDEHARLRRAVTDGLAQFNRHGIRRHVTRYTHRLAATFAARGEADLIRDYAEQLPMLVMTRLLGMPEESGPRLVAACLDLMKGTETAVASNDFVADSLRALVRHKREQPGRDFADSLITHGSGLTEDEIVHHLRLVLIAANETTVNLVANTLRLLLTDRRFRASLSGGQMTLPDAMEQVLWDAPPVSVIPGRWATGDTVLGGQHIKAGDMLLLGLAAGNTDPRIRPDRAPPRSTGPLPPRLQQRPPRVPRQGHRPCHRGGGHRHPAHPAARPGAERPGGRTVHHRRLDDRAGDRAPRTVHPPPGPRRPARAVGRGRPRAGGQRPPAPGVAEPATTPTATARRARWTSLFG
ncbi:cytochrome P450 [Streptomyces clavuligerus]|uniref:cytochrome P450 n=1 Tax=Streptomyces clavuligerus TaxID=1901 RepID=UPI0039C73709